jgi:hypothetical protein
MGETAIFLRGRESESGQQDYKMKFVRSFGIWNSISVGETPRLMSAETESAVLISSSA